jgi:hypothetical protein
MLIFSEGILVIIVFSHVFVFFQEIDRIKLYLLARYLCFYHEMIKSILFNS